MEKVVEREEWTMEIKSGSSWFDLNLKELWRYRDLIMLFVRRDFVAFYKQTILGPFWHLAQPLILTLTYTFIFGRVANLSSDGLPKIVFYLSGIILWTFFANNLTKTSSTFVSNAGIFGKVYFPRLAVPISQVLSNFIALGIKFLLFLLIVVYYANKGNAINITPYVLVTPFLFILIACLGLGLGTIIAALTTKYRDFNLLINFSIQLLMFATPIIYPLSEVPGQYRWIIELNPMTAIVESFRYAYFEVGTFSVGSLLYSTLFSLCSVVLGAAFFNKVEKTFMDTV